MNWLMIIIVACLVLSIFDGYKKGFMRTVFSLVSWILVLVICNVATPMVTDFLIKETNIEESISVSISEKINEMIAESKVAELEETMPEELKTALLGEEGNLEEILAANGEEMVNATSIVYTIISAIGLVIVIIVARVLLIVVDGVLGIASKLPLIGSVDKILGVACGGIKGILICWVILTVVYVLAFTGVNTELAGFIADSQLLSWLQENNYILKMVMPE